MTDHHDIPEPAGADADTPLEPWLQALADDYHRPPPAPREAMWERIQAARSADPADDRGVAAVTVVAAGTVRAAERAAGEDDLARRRASRGGMRGGNGRGLPAWAGPSLGMAAALMLAAGLAWRTRTPAATTVTPPAAPTVAAAAPALAGNAPAGAARPDGGRPGERIAADRRPTAPDAAARSAGGARAGATRRGSTVRPVADSDVATDGGLGMAGANAAGNAAGAPYRLAAAQYLGQAEALLTVFRAGAMRDASDPSLQPWARELLTTTRLLIDSPAARDPRLGALLDELEPVLVQIVQLPAARAAEERQLIARSIERSDLMTQLRSAVPAGPAVPQRAGE